MNSLLRKILVTLSFVGVVVVNALANALPINGVTTGGVSDSFPNLFTPAGFTFSIWGIIYLLLAGFVLFSLGVLQKKRSIAAEKIASLFILSSLANIAWIFSWHYGLIWLSVVFMIGILFSLLLITKKLSSLKLSTKEQWFVRLPFSVYLGWITIATIANITVFLVSVNWGGLGLSEEFWTITIVVIGALIGLRRSFINQDIAYLLVFIWAYTGILTKHLTAFASEHTGIIITLITCISMFIVMTGILTKQYKKYIKQAIKRAKTINLNK